MTTFYEHVWAYVRRIPRGRVTTYGRVARALGNPRASRAVGYALKAVPPDGDVPWQRVVNAEGRVSPRADHDRLAPDVQRLLLEREGVVFKLDGSLDLEAYGWDGA